MTGAPRGRGCEVRRWVQGSEPSGGPLAWLEEERWQP